MPQPDRARALPGLAAPWPLLAMLTLAACGERMTTDILPGGIPARTDLHQASGLPLNRSGPSRVAITAGG